MNRCQLSRLSTAVNHLAGLPFLWGAHDCVTFTTRCLDYATGSQHSSKFIGKYCNLKTALQYQKSFMGLGDYLRSIGVLQVSPSLKLPGDILVGFKDGFQCGHIWFDGGFAQASGLVHGEPDFKYEVFRVTL